MKIDISEEVLKNWGVYKITKKIQFLIMNMNFYR